MYYCVCVCGVRQRVRANICTPRCAAKGITSKAPSSGSENTASTGVSGHDSSLVTLPGNASSRSCSGDLVYQLRRTYLAHEQRGRGRGRTCSGTSTSFSGWRPVGARSSTGCSCRPDEEADHAKWSRNGGVGGCGET
jgi:hypothetical protein